VIGFPEFELLNTVVPGPMLVVFLIAFPFSSTELFDKIAYIILAQCQQRRIVRK
jgi:hypothetical protein